MKVTGHIPIKPHLLAYIRYRENLTARQPLLIPGSNVVAMYLDSLLTNKKAVRDDPRHTMNSYEAQLPILFTSTRVKWRHLYFTSTRVQNFNSFVSRLMVSDLVNRIMEAKKLNNQQERVTIAKFQHEAKLWDIDFDSLKKASYRHRKKVKKQLFYTRNSPGGAHSDQSQQSLGNHA